MEMSASLGAASDAASVLSRISDAFIVLDRDYRFVDVNPAAERSMQKTRAELLGRSHWDVFPASYDVQAGRCYRLAAETRVEQHFTQHYTGEGYDVHLEMDAYPTDQGGVAVFWRDVTARVKAEQALRTSEQALRLSEERYRLAGRATSNAIWDWTVATGELTWNEGVFTVFGYRPGEVSDGIDWWSSRMHPDDHDRVLNGMQAVIDAHDGATEWQDSYRFRRQDGAWADVFDRGYVARDETGRAVHMIGAMEDVTGTRQLEERLRQAQKMEAVGKLAGGIAHDFNNLLTVISGNLEFVSADLPADHPVRADLEQIGDAASRARALVRQLLTFSRQQPVQPRLVSVSDIVLGAEKLLRRVIGEEIAFEVMVDEPGPTIYADAGQLEQVLMNMAVNARDAMLTGLHGKTGTGGALTIEVTTVAIAFDDVEAWDTLQPGTYARIIVRDTGHGMDMATQARVFEPFFTTKAVGSGTGLGLATVHGIITQSGGAIHIDSRPGVGTAFTVMLPVVRGAADAITEDFAADTPRVSATILVVEDESPVRAVIRRALERFGYRVLTARHGADALLLWRQHRTRIEVVVTDLRMPEMGGRELVKRLRSEGFLKPVVFVSGYADEGTRTAIGPDEQFVEKPFTTHALLQAVGNALNLNR